MTDHLPPRQSSGRSPGGRLPDEPIEVAPDVWLIRLPLPFALRYVNVYVLRDGDHWILIDTGLDRPESQDALRRQVAGLDLDWGQLSLILITHFHPDHYGNASWIQRQTGAPAGMAAVEAQVAREFCVNLDRVIEEHDAFLRRHSMPADQVGPVVETTRRLWQGRSPADVTVELTEQWSLDWGGRTWQAISTPGHSPGHRCFLSAGERLLLSGDHVLGRITPIVGAGDWMPPDPLADFLASLDRVLTLPADHALPAHGHPFDNVHGRARQIQHHHIGRLDLTREAVRQGARTGYEVMRVLFPQELNPHELRFALSEAVAHLDHLSGRGELRRVIHPRAIHYEPSSNGMERALGHDGRE